MHSLRKVYDPGKQPSELCLWPRQQAILCVHLRRARYARGAANEWSCGAYIIEDQAGGTLETLTTTLDDSGRLCPLCPQE